MSTSPRKRQIRRHRWLALLLSASTVTPLVLATTTPWGVESLLQVDLNRQNLQDNTLVIREPDGGILVAREDLQRWRVRLPEQAVVQVDGKDYFRLQSIPGAVYAIDEASQRLSIELPASGFSHYALGGQMSPAPVPASASPGAFFNYDLLAEQTDQSPVKARLSGLFELGYFNRWGVGLFTFASYPQDNHNTEVRLDTTWTVDQPDKRATWRLGDAISRATSGWGLPTRFGGLQYSTNFAVQPGFLTMPQQSISAQAGVPSSVDVFVNNALVSRSEVPPGPFSINNIPTITGQGEVRVVVKDLLGREQVITQAFFANAKLLRAGLDDFSYELGRERQNYGQASNDYGRWLAAGTYKRGINDHLTGELHAEQTSNAQTTLGANGVWGLESGPVFNASAAASSTADGAGYLSGAGVELQHKRWSFSAHTQNATQRFVQIGQAPGVDAVSQLGNLNVGYFAPGLGNFGMGYVAQERRDATRTELLSLSYSTQLGRAAFLGFSALRTLSGTPSDYVGAFVVVPLDNRTHFSANAQRSTVGAGASSSLFNTQIQRSLVPGDTWGYRLQASDDGAIQAEVNLQNSVGDYTLAAAQRDGVSAQRVGASGGVAALGGALFASRRISDSFALVQVPGYADVRVYKNNQLIGRTDRSGNALVPGVRAYEVNPLTIEALDLPMDARVDALQRDAVAYYRSGVVLRFPVGRARAATLKVRLPNGTWLPAGATVRLESPQQFEALDRADTVFAVGFDGQVYVSGLSERNVLIASWPGQRCRLAMEFIASDEPLPFLGEFLCEGLTP